MAIGKFEKVPEKKDWPQLALDTALKLSTERTRVVILEKSLKEIERFGHNEGHGRGYTCADMAAKALAELPAGA